MSPQPSLQPHRLCPCVYSCVCDLCSPWGLSAPKGPFQFVQRAWHTVGAQNCVVVNTRMTGLPLNESLGANMAESTGGESSVLQPGRPDQLALNMGADVSGTHTTEPGLKPRTNTSTGTLTTHLTADLPAHWLLVLELVIREMGGPRKPVSKSRAPCSPPCGGWPRLWGWQGQGGDR